MLLSIASFAFVTLGLNVVGADWVVGSAFAAIIFGGAAFARFVERSQNSSISLDRGIKRSFGSERHDQTAIQAYTVKLFCISASPTTRAVPCFFRRPNWSVRDFGERS
jgi:hypothetical protein